MKERNVLIICIVAILCTVIVSAGVILINSNSVATQNNSSDEEINVTINNTENNTTQTYTNKATTTTKKNTDPDYDPERDASHQHATEDNPVTVQQSDGEYTYYGPGHYDYYAGGSHMSGEYYKQRNNQ